MPCQDSTALIEVQLDSRDHLVDFRFSKITCGKDIGGGTGYVEFCRGKSIEELSGYEFFDLVERFGLTDPDMQFFLYLEWDALRTALLQYLGQSSEIDPSRYRLDSIEYGEQGVTIRQNIRPPSEMPKVVSCATRNRNSPA